MSAEFLLAAGAACVVGMALAWARPRQAESLQSPEQGLPMCHRASRANKGIMLINNEEAEVTHEGVQMPRDCKWVVERFLSFK